MRVGWKFLAGLTGGFLLLIGLNAAAFYLILGVPTEGITTWLYQINEKKWHLAKQRPSPKILVVGGSATLFGVSARELEKQTGQPTVNLGNTAALRPAYMLYQAQRLARPGDTVLLVFEYEGYIQGHVERAWADSILLDYIISRDPEFFHHLSLIEQWNIFMLTSNQRLLNGLKNRFRPEKPFKPSGVYDIRLINDWGDQTRHVAATRTVTTESVLQRALLRNWVLPPKPNAFPIIQSFCQWAHAHHIRVLATFPNVAFPPNGDLSAPAQMARRIRDFYERIHVPVVGEFTDALLPPDQFFDSDFHPTEEAALARTQKLASQVVACLKEPPAF